MEETFPACYMGLHAMVLFSGIFPKGREEYGIWMQKVLINKTTKLTLIVDGIQLKGFVLPPSLYASLENSQIVQSTAEMEDAMIAPRTQFSTILFLLAFEATL